jgi:hypothetical protein
MLSCCSILRCSYRVTAFFVQRTFFLCLQEAGRAGRDGEPAECVIFFREADLTRLKNMIQVKTLQAHATSPTCANAMRTRAPRRLLSAGRPDTPQNMIQVDMGAILIYYVCMGALILCADARRYCDVHQTTSISLV